MSFGLVKVVGYIGHLIIFIYFCYTWFSVLYSVCVCLVGKENHTKLIGGHVFCIQQRNCEVHIHIWGFLHAYYQWK